jgi:tRNA(Ile)-lysidine synthase TilS/MesJ
MAQWGKLTYAQKNVLSSAGRLMHQTGMVGPGARVGVALSGGEDSFVLLQVLRMRRRIVPFHFDLMVLHVNPGFDPRNHAPLVDYCLEHGLALHAEVTDHGPMAHSAQNRKKSPCFLCSWNRRKHLFNLVERYNLTHLALGHNADDLAATFFLNLFQAGRVDGLAMDEPFFQGAVRVVRPLLWMEKSVIRRARKGWDLPVWQNPCPSAGRSRRSEVMEWMEEICKKDKRIRSNIFNALKRWQLDLTLDSD